MKTQLVLGLSLGLAACATTPQPHQRTCYHRSEGVETDIGYCQAIRSGNRLYISGTVGDGEMRTAIEWVYQQLKKTLLDNGLTFSDVVKENVFTTDLEGFKAGNDIRKGFYGSTLPAGTWVQVQRLFLPSYVLEVELIAEYPN